MTKAPLVSFVVPTLNRGSYVVRAVASCIAAETAELGALVEVIVLDSQSDDGSWEMLNDRFGQDDRVVLAQNKRGLGPTRSWLDGAKLVSGDYVTFLWSDDYVSPDFLSILLPPLLSGDDLAVGTGVIRDIDDDGPLPPAAGSLRIRAVDFLSGHFGLVRFGPWPLPVSPAAALMSRRVFDGWISEVERWCRATPLRRDVMWRRAIGPDLMLLMSAGVLGGEIQLFKSPVAQFSSHSGSITVSSSQWPLRAGYWLARFWALAAIADAGIPGPLYRAMAARCLAQGVMTALRAPEPRQPSSGAHVWRDVRELWTLGAGRCGSAALTFEFLRAMARAIGVGRTPEVAGA
jgi:hypothetical protein